MTYCNNINLYNIILPNKTHHITRIVEEGNNIQDVKLPHLTTIQSEIINTSKSHFKQQQTKEVMT